MTTADHADIDVTHQAEARRYVLRRAGEELGWLSYRPVDDGTVEVHSTVIADQARGAGLARLLVHDALDDLARDFDAVVPSCWYVDRYLEQTPEHAHLRAAASGGR